MAERLLMKGNEAIGEAAIHAGCRYYFGYPITPQSELTAYMARRLLKIEGAAFIQAESEIAAINMVYGASAAGGRVMTSSSSPGISLKQEGISYIACAELPCVIVNIMRGGPGLGSIQPAQGDYFQATKGGGHGDYHLIVLAPSSVQELVDLTIKAFDLSDKYRNPAMILGDGLLGQMMEPVQFKEFNKKSIPAKEDWALGSSKGREARRIVPFNLDPNELEKLVNEIGQKYQDIQKEVEYEVFNIDNPDIIIVAYGIVARIVKTAIQKAKKEGINIGLIRPITLYPFPGAAIEDIASKVEKILVTEMSLGQMVEDVKIAVNGKAKVSFYGRTGGVVISPVEILEEVKRLLK
ncbi:MAG: 3-methyl-2-oxobutanoate dehydrogenase subunit VorB [Atribacterota bacterium]|jgi:2-oxoglutarate ferredoxin oxidoreductase subunit alpha|nr:3-methyl-2-oxobutanoate dehydrogenase subunit VorB [Atribacterota bacterium]MDD4895522.1 3-methyl-2-oxobutanoate dehydrogenase subunit VorB [Atribacterota bacterium]MDD5637706.1 3-methyl-2-oxobutanoate dehydrogenase subunit VorB [Atribacterota bacterium]